MDELVARGQRLPQFDYHLPLQGLPRILGITLDNIPNKVPYLHAPKDRAANFAAKMPSDGKLHSRPCLVRSDVQRGRFPHAEFGSIPSADETAGDSILQPAKGRSLAQKPPPGVDWVDFSQELKEFADTAALIENLDLMISVDTSIAHLAGALAKPVWVLIPTQSDFRWLLDRTDSPWYPTMRLFRQPLGADWSKPIADLAKSLAEFARPE